MMKMLLSSRGFASSGKMIGTATVKAVKGKRLIPTRAALTLTPSAIQRIKTLLESHPDSIGLKIGVKQKGCNGLSYTLEYTNKKSPLDEEVLQDGVRVLIDQQALLTLLGTEMDYQESKLASEFVFNNPNIKGTCGCGCGCAVHDYLHKNNKTGRSSKKRSSSDVSPSTTTNDDTDDSPTAAAATTAAELFHNNDEEYEDDVGSTSCESASSPLSPSLLEEDLEDSSSSTSRVRQISVETLHTEQVPNVNGNLDPQGEFHEWHQTYTVPSVNGELLHILPYTVIDF